MVSKLSFFGVLLALGAAAAAVVAVASSTAFAPRVGWQAKVESRVLLAAEQGSADVIVYLQQKADLSRADSLGPDAKGQYVYDRLTAVARESQAPVVAELQRRGLRHRAFWVSNAIWVRGADVSDLEALASRSDVRHVYSVGSGKVVLPAQTGVSSLRQGPQTTTAVGNNIAKVKADQVWAMGINGNGAVVAGADTGVRWTHDALKGHYRGWDGTTANHNYNWHDAIKNPNGTECVANSPTPCDDDVLLGGGHGTHTMGTMVGDDGAGNQIGMAPGAKWMACRNMTNGVGIVPTYLECMQWFLAPTRIDGTIPDPAKRPNVVNNSWGCVEACPPPLLQDILQASRNSGIFYAVSAGNDGVPGPLPGCSTIYHPLARYPEAFTVGSTIIATDAISDFSSRGPVLGDPTAPAGLTKPNIVAPGSTVRSSLRATDSTYGNLSGTSMAGPHVAGLVALIVDALQETQPAKTRDVEFLETTIEQTALHLTTTEGCGGDTNTTVPNNTFGWGRIDALAAVQRALAGPTAVSVGRFAARRAAGSVSVSWRTSSETETIGFNVWRSPAGAAAWQRLNGTMIVAKRSGQSRGAAYRFVDRGARIGRAYAYRLQLVDLTGRRSWSVLGTRTVR